MINPLSNTIKLNSKSDQCDLKILFSNPHFEVKLLLQSQRQHQVKFKTLCYQTLAIPARTSMINPLSNSIKSNAKSDVISPKTVLESLEILFSILCQILSSQM